jgi:monoamine oxidase
MTFAVANEGVRLEGTDKTQIIDEIEAVFKNAFSIEGEENNDNFRPDDVEVATWWNDKHFRGSYSFMPTHSMAGIPWNHLTKPLTGTAANTGFKTLYFTGEALDPDYSGYVHGGLRAGLTTANQIISESKNVEEILL